MKMVFYLINKSSYLETDVQRATAKSMDQKQGKTVRTMLQEQARVSTALPQNECTALEGKFKTSAVSSIEIRPVTTK
jgi:hypothetical protein